MHTPLLSEQNRDGILMVKHILLQGTGLRLVSISNVKLEGVKKMLYLLVLIPFVMVALMPIQCLLVASCSIQLPVFPRV